MISTHVAQALAVVIHVGRPRRFETRHNSSRVDPSHFYRLIGAVALRVFFRLGRVARVNLLDKHAVAGYVVVDAFFGLSRR